MLASAVSDLGLLQQVAAAPPTVLFWGRESPGTSSKEVGDALAGISERLGEQKNHRTEPDVILDFGRAGVVFFEAKLGSSNDSKDNAQHHWDKYVLGTPAFRDAEMAIGTRLYQLARNWRFAYELADDRPFCLANLVVSKQGEALEPFARSLATTDERQFREITWAELVAAGGSTPPWLLEYLQGPGISLSS